MVTGPSDRQSQDANADTRGGEAIGSNSEIRLTIVGQMLDIMRQTPREPGSEMSSPDFR